MKFDSEIDISKAVLQAVEFPDEIPVKIFMKRLDLIHPSISGNKWFKLKYNLVDARENGFDTLVTFGGAFSNHIYATAAAGKEYGFKTIGIIRGEEHSNLNPTLEFAASQGMRFVYVTRSDYRKKHLQDFTNWIHKKFGNVYIVPEGGTNQLALKGCREIPPLIEIDYDYLCTPCGTAGTLSGLITGLSGKNKILGFSVLRGGSFLIKQAERLIIEFSQNEYSNWSINLDYHFGGYAKINRELILFIRQFEEINGIILDPVYTGKMMYGIMALAKEGFFNENVSIVALHTGGVQGIEGMKEKMNIILSNKIPLK